MLYLFLGSYGTFHVSNSLWFFISTQYLSFPLIPPGLVIYCCKIIWLCIWQLKNKHTYVIWNINFSRVSVSWDYSQGPSQGCISSKAWPKEDAVPSSVMEAVFCSLQSAWPGWLAGWLRARAFFCFYLMAFSIWCLTTGQLAFSKPGKELAWVRLMLQSFLPQRHTATASLTARIAVNLGPQSKAAHILSVKWCSVCKWPVHTLLSIQDHLETTCHTWCNVNAMQVVVLYVQGIMTKLSKCSVEIHLCFLVSILNPGLVDSENAVLQDLAGWLHKYAHTIVG